MIGIIDYGAGNLKSVEKAFLHLGYDAKISRDKDFLSECDKIVLPGVGAFKDCMAAIVKEGMDRVIYDSVSSGKPFLGICLGMQLLFESSEENGHSTGLGILKGRIVKIPDRGLKIPQIGWNQIRITNPNAKLLKGIGEEYFYFVHSYYLQPKCTEDVCAVCDYGETLSIACEHENIYATQFHPEKSSESGLKLLTNFANL